MKFFKPEDFDSICFRFMQAKKTSSFELADLANAKLEREGKHLVEHSFTGGTDYWAIPMPTKPCTHPVDKIEVRMDTEVGFTGYRCQCGAKVVPESFKAV